jgi:putative MATE family efflux protein
MLDKRVFVWEKEFTRSIFRLGIPMMLQSVVAALMHIVDNVMVSTLGDVAMAGVTQANRISFLFQLTMFGAVSGAAVFAAQYWSAKDVKSIRHVMGMGLIIAVAIAALFALPTLLFSGPIMRLLIANEEARAIGASYLRVIIVTYFVQSLSLLFESILRSTEKVVLPMVASVMAIAVNTTFNYLLIGGNFGFPALGVRGAAFATIIGASVELAILIIVSYRKRYATAARIHELKIPSRAFIKKYFKIVLPVILNEGLWALGITVYSAAYGRMGDGKTIVAGIGIYDNIQQLASVMLRGVTHAAAVMIGIVVGSGDEKASILYAKRFLFGSFVVGFVAGVAVLALRDPILSIYTEITPETIAVARYIVTIYALSLWMKAMCTQLIVGMLRPGGDVVFSMFIDVAPLWVFSIPLVFICGVALKLPIETVYPLTLIEEVVKVLICVYRMRTGKWIHNLTAQQYA